MRELNGKNSPSPDAEDLFAFIVPKPMKKDAGRTTLKPKYGVIST